MTRSEWLEVLSTILVLLYVAAIAVTQRYGRKVIEKRVAPYLGGFYLLGVAAWQRLYWR